MKNDIKKKSMFAGMSFPSNSQHSDHAKKKSIMPKFTENFGMTFAKKWTYRAPEIHRNGNESTFRRNIGHSDHLPKHDMSKTWHIHISHVQFKFAYKFS